MDIIHISEDSIIVDSSITFACASTQTVQVTVPSQHLLTKTDYDISVTGVVEACTVQTNGRVHVTLKLATMPAVLVAYREFLDRQQQLQVIHIENVHKLEELQVQLQTLDTQVCTFQKVAEQLETVLQRIKTKQSTSFVHPGTSTVH